MSVLLAYGTSMEAVIMSDSRATYFDKNNNILGYEENRKKIYKITDKFIIGSVGNANSSNILENININDSNSLFSLMKDASYEKWISFFTDRIKIFGIDKISYSPYIAIGIDSNNKIRMDTFNNLTYNFDTVYPKDDDIFSTIYFSSNIVPNFKDKFSDELARSANMEKYCQETIRKISQIDNTVNSNIQKFKVSL